jgi:hypothetical protein
VTQTCLTQRFFLVGDVGWGFVCSIPASAVRGATAALLAVL